MSDTSEMQKIIGDSTTKITDMLKFAEAKCISIIAVNSAIALFFFNVKNLLLPEVSSIDFVHKHTADLLFYLSAISMVVLSSFISCLAIFPKFITTKSKNYLFFFDINNLNSPTELISEYEKYFTDGKLNLLYTEHLAQSLFGLSKITTNKNYIFRISLSITIISILLFFMFLLFCIL